METIRSTSTSVISAARNFANSLKEEPKKQYSCVTICTWIIALVSMFAMTLKDIVQLTDRYNTINTVLKQDLVSASADGVKLPNMTICIWYNTKFEDKSFKHFKYLDFSTFDLEQAFEFAHRLHYVDYVTTTFRNWDPFVNVAKKYSTKSENDIVLSFKDNEYVFRYEEKNLDEFWNYFARKLCEALRVQLNIMNKGSRRQVLDVCDEVGKGTIPFTIVDNSTVCFRAPLDRILFKANDSAYEIKNNSAADNNIEDMDILSAVPMFNGRKIVLSFQPLLLWQLLHLNKTMEEDYKVSHAYEIFAFFPETELSYINQGFDKKHFETHNRESYNVYNYENRNDEKNLKTQSTQFYNVYKYEYKNGYAKSVWLPIRFSIAGKENKMSDCIDIFDKTGCIIKCIEQEFRKICKCRRFMYRHYTRLISDDHQICSAEHYLNCSDQYKSFLFDQQNKSNIDNLIPCQKMCSECSKQKFDYYEEDILVTDSVHPRWKQCDIFKEFFKRQYTSDIDNQYGNNHKNVDWDLTNKGSSKTVMDKYATHIMEFAEKHNSFKNRYYETLFGRVYYVISVETENFYPVYSEYKLAMTEDEFRSQIGGTIGLYLGFSCLTGFTVFIQFLKYLKNRWLKRQQKIQQMSSRTMTVLNLWRLFGIQSKQKDLPNAEDQPKISQEDEP